MALTLEERLQINSNLATLDKPITLADIVRAIEEVKKLPQPFNGATNVHLSPDVHTKLADVLTPYISAPITRRILTVEIREILPPGHGFGWRPWRIGDDPELEHLGPVLVWHLAPPKPA